MISYCRHLLLFVLLAAVFAESGLAQCLFVNTNSSPNSVAGFSVNADGSLTAVAGSPFATGGDGAFDAAVGSTGLSVGTSRLYVSNPSSNSVSGFDIADDCTLSAVPGSPVAAGSSALGLEPDPDGEFLYVANFLGDSVSVFAIATDGSLSEITGSPFTTPSTPFDIVFDPAGDQLFISHDFAGAVGSYTQAADGTFAPVAGSPFSAGGFEHGLAINSDASRVYVADFGPDTVTGYAVGGDGTLSPLPGSPYSPGVEPIELLVSADDRFLFATNDNAENIAVLDVDATGDLTPVAGSPFASDSVGPAGLAQDPGGEFLFVANGGFSGNADVSVFTVGSDGALTPVSGSPFPTGGTGNATGIAYFATSLDLSVAVVESGDPVIAGSGAGNLTYTTTLSNAGPAAATGVTVDFVSSLPGGVSLESQTPSDGSFAGSTWTVPSLASGGSATLTTVFTVSSAAAPGSDVITADASITAADQTDSDATNDSDSEQTSVVTPALVTGAKTVAGVFSPGGTIIYTVTLVNGGGAAQMDNVGDEFVDLLPGTLMPQSAMVVSGGGTATLSGDTVVWNGSIAPGASVILEIAATIAPGTEGQQIANQGQVFFDGDGNGTNESMTATDDPGIGGAADPTVFVVVSVLDVPIDNPIGLSILGLLLAAAAVVTMMKRS